LGSNDQITLVFASDYHLPSNMVATLDSVTQGFNQIHYIDEQPGQFRYYRILNHLESAIEVVCSHLRNTDL